jgi:hypothetical protein
MPYVTTTYPAAVGNGAVVQLVVFEESRSLLAHGDTSPGHHLLWEKVSPMSLEFFVNYVLDWFNRIASRQ